MMRLDRKPPVRLTVPLLTLLVAISVPACGIEPGAGPARNADILTSAAPISPEPQPAPLPQASPRPTATPAPASPEASYDQHWIGTLVRQNGLTAVMDLQLKEERRSGDLTAVSGAWSLQGEIHDQSSFSGYHDGRVWSVVGTLGNQAVRLEAPDDGRSLRGMIKAIRGGSGLGHFRLNRR